jgi:glycine cleavage system H protein
MAQESYPEDLLYHPDHDWARIEPAGVDPADAGGGGGPEATLGITWYAQEQLGEVVFFEAPNVGAVLARGEPYAEVESVKAVSDVVAPLSGEIVAVNDALADTPGAINEDPYGEGWLVRIKLGDPAERERLLDAKAYSATLSG